MTEPRRSTRARAREEAAPPAPETPSEKPAKGAKSTLKRKRTSIAVKDSTSTPGTPVDEAALQGPKQTLPLKIAEGRPLPTLPEPQPLDLSSAEWQNIQQSGVLSASLQRSRAVWVSGVNFRTFHKKHAMPKKVSERTEADKAGKARQKEIEKNFPQVGVMDAQLVIEPHTFPIKLYAPKEGSRPAHKKMPPPQQYGAWPNHSQHSQHSQHGQHGQHGQHPPQYQQYNQPPYQPKQQPQPRPPPPKPVQQAPPQTAPGPASTPAPDPVIHMLAARAGTDPELKAVMKIVAAGQASKAQLEFFQTHINELTEILEKNKKAKAPLPLPLPPNPGPSKPQATPPIPPPKQQTTGPPKQQTASPAPSQQQTPSAPPPTSQNSSSATSKPHTPAPAPPKQSPAPAPAPASASILTPSPAPALAPSPAPALTPSPAPPKQQAPAPGPLPPAPRPAPPTPQQHQAPPSTTTPKPFTPAPPQAQLQRPPSSHSRPPPPNAYPMKNYNQPPYYQQPPPHYAPSQPPRVTYRPLTFEFVEGNGDRFYFPSYSFMEWLPNGSGAKFSFLVTKLKPKPEGAIKTLSTPVPPQTPAPAAAPTPPNTNGPNNTPFPPTPGGPTATPTPAPTPSYVAPPRIEDFDDRNDMKDIDFYQPVTVLVLTDEHEVKSALPRAIRPPSVVEKYMEEVFDTCKRAGETYLAFRLPREGNVEADAGAKSGDATPKVGTPIADVTMGGISSAVAEKRKSIAGRSRKSLAAGAS